jgi:hypothetical protein
MTFREAKDKLKELANGRAYVIGFQFKQFSLGKTETECQAWIDGGKWITAPTWVRLFDLLENNNPVEEIPEVEDGGATDEKD